MSCNCKAPLKINYNYCPYCGEKLQLPKKEIEILIKGGFGSGKTTIMHLLSKMLRAYGLTVSETDDIISPFTYKHFSFEKLDMRMRALSKNIKINLRTIQIARNPHESKED